MKLHFKKCESTGKYRAFQPKSIEIKADGKKCGWIDVQHNACTIFFHIKRAADGNDPCNFKNIRLQTMPDTENSAKEFIKKNWEAIQTKYALYQIED